eukprot:g18434.t1
MGTVEMFTSLSAYVLLQLVQARRLYVPGALFIFLLTVACIALQKIEVASAAVIKLDFFLISEQVLAVLLVVFIDIEPEMERFTVLLFLTHVFYLREMIKLTPYLGSGESFKYFRSAKFAEYLNRSVSVVETERAATKIHLDKAEADVAVHHAKEDLKEKTAKPEDNGSVVARNELHALAQLGRKADRAKLDRAKLVEKDDELLMEKVEPRFVTDVAELRKRDSGEQRYLSKIRLPQDNSGATNHTRKSQAFPGAYALEARLDRLLLLFEHPYVLLQLDDTRLHAIEYARKSVSMSKRKITDAFPAAARPPGAVEGSGGPSQLETNYDRLLHQQQENKMQITTPRVIGNSGGRSNREVVKKHLRATRNRSAPARGTTTGGAIVSNLRQNVQKQRARDLRNAAKVKKSALKREKGGNHDEDEPFKLYIPAKQSWVELHYQGSRGLALPYYVSPVLLRNSWLRPGDVPDETDDEDTETPLPGKLFRIATTSIFAAWVLACVWTFFAYTLFRTDAKKVGLLRPTTTTTTEGPLATSNSTTTNTAIPNLRMLLSKSKPLHAEQNYDMYFDNREMKEMNFQREEHLHQHPSATPNRQGKLVRDYYRSTDEAYCGEAKAVREYAEVLREEVEIVEDAWISRLEIARFLATSTRDYGTRTSDYRPADPNGSCFDALPADLFTKYVRRFLDLPSRCTFAVTGREADAGPGGLEQRAPLTATDLVFLLRAIGVSPPGVENMRDMLAEIEIEIRRGENHSPNGTYGAHQPPAAFEYDEERAPWKSPTATTIRFFLQKCEALSDESRGCLFDISSLSCYELMLKLWRYPWKSHTDTDMSRTLLAFIPKQNGNGNDAWSRLLQSKFILDF